MRRQRCLTCKLLLSSSWDLAMHKMQQAATAAMCSIHATSALCQLHYLQTRPHPCPQTPKQVSSRDVSRICNSSLSLDVAVTEPHLPVLLLQHDIMLSIASDFRARSYLHGRKPCMQASVFGCRLLSSCWSTAAHL